MYARVFLGTNARNQKGYFDGCTQRTFGQQMRARYGANPGCVHPTFRMHTTPLINSLICSTFLFACLRCILNVGFCCGDMCGTCLVVCASTIESFAWLMMRSLLARNSCLYDGWENTHVFCTVTKGLHAWGGNLPFYYSILCVVQTCRVFQKLHLDCVCNLVPSFL